MSFFLSKYHEKNIACEAYPCKGQSNNTLQATNSDTNQKVSLIAY